MDWRLLGSGLILDAISPTLFLGLLGNFATQHNSIPLINVSIASMTAFLLAGLAFAAYGFVRRGIMNDTQAGALFLGSFALGILSFTYGLSVGQGYGDDLAACGGSPPGVLWGPNDTVLTRCDIFYHVPSYSVLGWVWMIPLITATLVFVSSFLAARRNSLQGSTKVSSAQR